MKYAEEHFPKGTFPYQKTDGAYIDEDLASNLDILAQRIVDDMHFMILITGHDSVGNGKTTLLTQIGSYLTWKINQHHKVNNSFTHRNLVFSGDKLAQRSFQLPKYSVIGLDEGDDLTTHAVKELAIRLKRYFRKCRQLNQILVLILPSFFELPKFYALARSHMLLDVKFYDDFRRGTFDFYSMARKKSLYIKGKRDWNYDVCKPDFDGTFTNGYVFFPDLENSTKLYKQQKYADMIDDHEEQKEKPLYVIKKEMRRELFAQVHSKLPKITIEQLSTAFGISLRTGSRWLAEEKAKKTAPVSLDSSPVLDYNNIPSKEEEEEDGSNNKSKPQ